MISGAPAGRIASGSCPLSADGEFISGDNHRYIIASEGLRGRLIYNLWIIAVADGLVRAKELLNNKTRRLL